MTETPDNASRTARELARRTGVDHHDVLVILGTGLASVAERLGAAGPSIPLATLPFFPRYTATGHHAQGWSVPIGGKMVLVFAGRCHAYEGIELTDVVHPLRTGIAAGCSTVILTAAVGGIREDLHTGSIVVVSDHLNLTGRSPLVGPEFVDMVGAYSPALRALAFRLRTRPRAGSPGRRPLGRPLHRRLCPDARAAVRDARRNPHDAHPRGRRGRHVHGLRDDRRPPCRSRRSRARRRHQRCRRHCLGWRTSPIWVTSAPRASPPPHRCRSHSSRHSVVAMTVTPLGVDHVSINVPDVPAAIDFYTNVLGSGAEPRPARLRLRRRMARCRNRGPTGAPPRVPDAGEQGPAFRPPLRRPRGGRRGTPGTRCQGQRSGSERPQPAPGVPGGSVGKLHRAARASTGRNFVMAFLSRLFTARLSSRPFRPSCCGLGHVSHPFRMVLLWPFPPSSLRLWSLRLKTVTKSSRAIAKAVDAALIVRDRTCCVPGCGKRLGLNETTSLSTTATMDRPSSTIWCASAPSCHALKTFGGWRLEGTPGNFTWIAPAHPKSAGAISRARKVATARPKPG